MVLWKLLRDTCHSGCLLVSNFLNKFHVKIVDYNHFSFEILPNSFVSSLLLMQLIKQDQETEFLNGKHHFIWLITSSL